MDYRERFELKEYHNERRLGRRIRLFHFGLASVLVLFGLNFWYLQGVRGDEFERLAENNRLRRVVLPPSRGVVTDRNGAVLASTRPGLNLVLRRDSLDQLDAQLERLAPILATTPEELRERYREALLRPRHQPLVLREDVELPELARIESRRERFRSVEVQETARRSYPNGAIASHALGYIGEVGTGQLQAAGDLERGDIVGKAGIERVYDELLRGRRGYQLVSVNNLGLRYGRSRVDRLPEHGRPLQLTIDLGLQRVLAEAFGEEVGGAVFLDARTGEVLALHSAPSYDPNLFVGGISAEQWSAIQDDPRRPLHNRVISSFYAPGSTFKVVMALAGLETGAITPDTKVYCSGSAVVYGARRLCWKRGGHGWVDVREALTHSCNVFFYQLGQSLGVDEIHRFGDALGLGKPTGVDLSGESSGILPSEEWKRRVHGEPWYPGDTISIAIGQGLLAVTPMQMATMAAGVANGGLVPHPHLRLGESPAPTETHIREANLALVRQALVDVVREGTGRNAALPSIQVAGKTGTAQVYKHSAGIDADDLPKDERDHAWFVGYAPAEAPTIAFAVVVEHGGHGGTTAAPIARKVLEAYFDRDRPQETTEPPSGQDRIARIREARGVGAASSR